MMSLVFVSYSRKDTDLIMPIVRDLRLKGVPIWIDKEDIPIGEAWDRAIEEALQKSSHILMFLSPSSVASENVMDELNYAIEENKVITPVLINECKLPFRLRRKQYIDLREEGALAQLIKVLPVSPKAEETRLSEANTIHILVVDDSDGAREQLSQLFLAQGWKVTQARTNAEARNYLSNTTFNLVTTDCLRRADRYGESGFVGLDLVVELQDTIPVVLISRDSFEVISKLRPELAPWGFIDKHKSDGAILEIVGEVLAGKRVLTP